MHLSSKGQSPVNRAWPDAAIAELAARQAANVGHAQLRALGVAPSTIASALARGRLHPVHHGVHSLVPPGARPRYAAEHAALLACGPRALLSHATGGRLQGLEVPGRPDEVDVTIVGAHRSRGRAGLSVHVTAQLDRRERMRIGGLRVTTIPRVVLDLAPTCNERELERLVDQALRKCSLSKLKAVMDLHPGRPGTPALRRLLVPDRPSSDTWSVREEQLLQRIRTGGLPAPECNEWVGRYRPDLLWREYRVIAEYQSREFHRRRHQQIADLRRANDLTSWGFQVIHITFDDLLVPERVLVWISSALTRAGWSGASR